MAQNCSSERNWQLPTGFPEILAKKLGENLKKPRRSTQIRSKIC